MDITQFPLSPRVTRHTSLQAGIRGMFANLFRRGTVRETLLQTLQR